jgi:nicastrin
LGIPAYIDNSFIAGRSNQVKSNQIKQSEMPQTMLKSFAFMLSCLLQAPFIQATSNTPSLDEPFQKSFSYLAHAPCVSLFHRNGRIGCGTIDRSVQIGKLQFYSADTWSAPKENYVVVLEESLLSQEVVVSFYNDNKNGYLQGVLVLNSTSVTGTIYSPAARGPSGKRTPSQKLNYGNSAYQWNAHGDGLSETGLYGLPMVYVTDMAVSETLRSASQTASDDYSIVAEFNYYMGPDEMKSATCLSWVDPGDHVWRPKCLPLGGTSVWATAATDSTARRNLADSGAKEVVMLATSIDAGSLFHDATPGTNTAASNILTLLMAAKLVGGIPTSTLAGFNKKIAFGFFQGEAFGFLGSRAFLKDVMGFTCDTDMTVPSVWKTRNSSSWPESACLYPLRPSLEFQNLGNIAGMITVDQVGVLATAQQLYVHKDATGFGGFISEVLQASSSNSYTVSAVQAQADDDHFSNNDITVPPTPLTSLLSITSGGTGGAVLTGFGQTFSGFYHSHRDTPWDQTIDMDAIATAATLLARAAVAAAYDDGSFNSNNAAAYAVNLVAELSSSDATLMTLQDCLFYNGNCDALRNYAKIEQANDKLRTGIDMGIGSALGTPPNYYVSVFQGQPIVQVGDFWYGAYTAGDYGKRETDTFAFRPTLLEKALKGMLNDFLGRPGVDLTTCKTTSDCSGVEYCFESAAVCTGGQSCVCSQAHYHIAMDEALLAAPNNGTGKFLVNPKDEDISAMYTEPNWSMDVGVRVYRDAENKAGTSTLISGLVMAVVCVVSTMMIKSKMVREKLY